MYRILRELFDWIDLTCYILLIVFHIILSILNPFEIISSIGSVNFFDLSISLPPFYLTGVDINISNVIIQDIGWNRIKLKVSLFYKKITVDVDSLTIYSTIGPPSIIKTPDPEKSSKDSKQPNTVIDFVLVFFQKYDSWIDLKFRNSNQLFLRVVSESYSSAQITLSLNNSNIKLNFRHFDGWNMIFDATAFDLKVYNCWSNVEHFSLGFFDSSLDLSSPSSNRATTRALKLKVADILIVADPQNFPSLLWTISTLLNSFIVRENHHDIIENNFRELCVKLDCQIENESNSHISPPSQLSESNAVGNLSQLSQQKELSLLKFSIVLNLSVRNCGIALNSSTASDRTNDKGMMNEFLRLQSISVEYQHIKSSKIKATISIASLYSNTVLESCSSLTHYHNFLINARINSSNPWFQAQLTAIQFHNHRHSNPHAISCRIDSTYLSIDITLLSQILYLFKDLQHMIKSHRSYDNLVGSIKRQVKSVDIQTVVKNWDQFSQNDVDFTIGDISVHFTDMTGLCNSISVRAGENASQDTVALAEVISVTVSTITIQRTNTNDPINQNDSLIRHSTLNDSEVHDPTDNVYFHDTAHSSSVQLLSYICTIESVKISTSLGTIPLLLNGIQWQVDCNRSISMNIYSSKYAASDTVESRDLNFNSIPDFKLMTSSSIKDWIDHFSSPYIFFINANTSVQSVMSSLHFNDIILLSLINTILSHGLRSTDISSTAFKFLPLQLYSPYLFFESAAIKYSYDINFCSIDVQYLCQLQTEVETAIALVRMDNIKVSTSSINNILSSLIVSSSSDLKDIDLIGNQLQTPSRHGLFVKLQSNFERRPSCASNNIGRHTQFESTPQNRYTLYSSISHLIPIFEGPLFYVDNTSISEQIVVFGFMSTRNLLPLSSATISLETDSLKHLLHLNGYLSALYQDTCTSCKSFQLMGYESISLKSLNIVPPLYDLCTHGLIPVLHCPNSMALLTCHRLELQLSHQNTTVTKIRMNSLCLSKSSYGPYISQLAGTLSSLSVDELSNPLAIHTKIIHDFEDHNDSKIRLDFHFSCRRSVAPLLEIVTENIRVVYLQRVLLTLISYFRDHFIPSMRNNTEDGRKEWRRNWDNATFGTSAEYCGIAGDVDCGSDSEYYETQRIENECMERKRMSQFRFSVNARNAEIHFPTNSCGADSLTIQTPNLVTFMGRSDEPSEVKYCKGPHVVQGIWISDLESIQQLISPQYCTSIMSGKRPGHHLKQQQQPRETKDASKISSAGIVPLMPAGLSNPISRMHTSRDLPFESSTNSKGLTWNLPAHVDELKAPPKLSYYSGVKVDSYLDDVTMCTWCSRNAIGTGMSLRALVTVHQAYPFTRDLVGNDEEDFIFGVEPHIFPPGPRNTVLIDLNFNRVEWTVTQGQYQTITNFITQSFSEFQKYVQDLFVAPKSKTVPVGDTLYGKIIPEEILPLVTSVPITFEDGHIAAFDNEPEYFELLQLMQMNMHQLKQLSDPMPKWSNHHSHRKNLFTKSYPFTAPTGNSAAHREPHQLKDCTVFATREFQRELSRSGPSVHSIISPQQFENEENLQDNVKKSLFSIHFENLKVDFSRRHCGGGNSLYANAEVFLIADSMSHSFLFPRNGVRTGVNNIPSEKIIFAPRDLKQINSSGLSSSKESTNKCTETNFGTIDAKKHHIQYRQQGVSNLRRCCVYISDSITIVHIAPIMRAVKFFVEPIRLNFLRFMALMIKLEMGKIDLRTAMDCEVQAKNSIFCVPRNADSEGISVLCIDADFKYDQIWRGFQIAGPGCRTSVAFVNIKNIFLAPIHDIRTVGVESLIDQCEVLFTLDLKVLSEESSLHRKLQILSPVMMLSPQWCLKTSQTNHGIGIRCLDLHVTPIIDENSNEGLADSALESCTKSRTNSKVDCFADVPIDEQMKDDSSFPLQFRISIKDIEFICDAMQQLIQTIESLPKSQTIAEKYRSQFYSFYDISHLPLPTYFHPHVNYINYWDADVNEIQVHSSSVHITLRNNIYNINVAKVEFSDFQLNYHLCKNSLTVVSGGSCSIWTYNDYCNSWEPILEKATIRLIAATDSSQKNSTSSVLNSAIVRYEIDCAAVDFNIPQSVLSALIRKLHLPDVITTTSIHLPPYRIINELGVNINCRIKVADDAEDIKIEVNIPAGSYIPIERQQLTEASNKYLEQKKLQATSTSNQHRLDLEFSLGEEVYTNKDSMTIAHEGVFAFDMKPFIPLKSKKTLRKSPMRQQSVSNGVSADLDDDSSPQTVLSKLGSTASFKGETLSGSPHIPYAIAQMHIKSDGGRELALRSVLSLKNFLSEVVYVSIRKDGKSIEYSLMDGEEWHVPIQFAHPKASFYVRLHETLPWVEVLSSLQSFILQGKWAQPTKLKADVTLCTFVSNYTSSTSNWLLLVKPEVRESKNGVPTKNFVTVRYPTKENSKLAHIGASGLASSVNFSTLSSQFDKDKDGNQENNFTSLDDIYNMGLTSLGRELFNVQPMCLQLLAPLQLCNFVCQPLLYRLADSEGLIIAEGVLLSGEIVDIHNLARIFHSRVMISIRILNYCWSKWVKLYSKSAPFPVSEKNLDVSLPSLSLKYQSEDLCLPTLGLSLSIREHIVRISCPTIISNRTGIQLDFCDASTKDVYIPLSSRSAIEGFISTCATSVDRIRSTSQQKINLGMLSPMSGPQDAAAELNYGAAIRSDLEAVFDATNKQSKKFIIDSSLDLDTSLDFEDTSDKLTCDRENLSGSRDDSLNSTRVLSLLPPLRQEVPNVSLIIHMPFDHFRTIEMEVSGDAILLHVFNFISTKLASHRSQRTVSSYVFFQWEEGDNHIRKVVNAVNVDNQSYFNRVSMGFRDREATPLATETPSQPKNFSSRKSNVYTGLNHNDEHNIFANSTSSSTANEIPLAVQYDMVATFDKSLLTMETKVSELPCQRLRLCHVSEWNIYRQISGIKLGSKQKESLLQIFSRPKLSYSCPFMKFDGNVPFNPHRFLGFRPSLMLRVSNVTDWSSAFDLLGADFGTGNGYVRINNGNTVRPTYDDENNHNNNSDAQYEFGIFSEKGKGIYQGITSVQIVPKHIVISKLASTYVLRQFNVRDSSSYIQINLDSVQSFHFPSKWEDFYLQIRRASRTQTVESGPASSSDLKIDRIPSSTGTSTLLSPQSLSVDNFESAEEWFGQVDIASLGIIYVKLRNPLSIIKVQIEAVGASLTATFSTQNNLWPPYRIENNTSLDIRFRQLLKVSSGSSDQAQQGYDKLRSLSTVASPTLTKSNSELQQCRDNAQSNIYNFNVDSVPWDYLKPGESVPYAWDFPKATKRILTVEFKRIYNASEEWNDYIWVSHEVDIDTFKGTETIMVKKNIGSMSRTTAEGSVSVYSPKYQSVKQTFCVLQNDNIFVFKNKKQAELIDIVNLTKRNPRENQMILGRVEKYEERKKDHPLSFFNSSSHHSQSHSKKIDINRSRILQLLLAEYLGLFGGISRSNKVSSPTLHAPGSVSGPRLSMFTQTGVVTELDKDSNLKAHLQAKISVEQLLEKAQQLTFSIEDIIDGLINLGEAIDEVTAIELASHLYDQDIIQCIPNINEPLGCLSSEPHSKDSLSNLNDDEFNIPNVDFANAVVSDSVSLKPIETTTSDKSTDIPSRRQSTRESVERFSKRKSSRESTSPLGRKQVSFQQILEASSLSKIDVAENEKFQVVALQTINANQGISTNLVETRIARESAITALKSSITTYRISSILPMSFQTRQRTLESDDIPRGGDTPPSNTPDRHESPSKERTTLNVAAGLSTGSSQSEPLLRTASYAESLGRAPYELRFGSISLQPEVLETADSIRDHDLHVPHSEDKEIFAMTLNVATTEYQFVFTDQSEFMIWISNCRKSIEQEWVNFILSGEIGDDINMTQFNHEIKVCVHADGPTSALEINEVPNTAWPQSGAKVSEVQVADSTSQAVSPTSFTPVNNEAKSQSNFSTDTVHPKMSEKDSDFDDYSALNLEILDSSGDSTTAASASANMIIEAHVNSDDKRDAARSIKEIQQDNQLTLPPSEYFFRHQPEIIPNLTVIVRVNYVGFSIIDSEPAELMYIYFRGIDINVDRNRLRLLVGVTVQDFQIGNQLLNPSYPLMLYPRRSSLITLANSQVKLPGLRQSTDLFPGMHMYFQQKLSHSNQSQLPSSESTRISPRNTSSVEVKSGDDTLAHLMYFDRVSIWLSPLEINLDDEIIVRSIRYIQQIRANLRRPDSESYSRLREETTNIQYLGNRTWGLLNPSTVSDHFYQLQEAGRILYIDFHPLGKTTRYIYVTFLQLHPIDFELKFRSLTGFNMTTTEHAAVSLVSQLDSCHMTLNPFYVEHAFGTSSLVLDAILKHYKYYIWKQFHKFIGTDNVLIEGSTGSLSSSIGSNLGIHVEAAYFDEDDTVDDSFFTGLSRGGKSLASNAIGGTTVVTSGLVGALGSSMSLMTLDSEFQRNRANRRLTKAKTVSQGIYVGSKEFGKNVLEGVSGLVVAPYRGWEENGATGLGLGIAKGIIGVPLKPIVGAFDLVNRVSEGIRYAAKGGLDSTTSEFDINVSRARIPRHFGKFGVILPYSYRYSAAQYLADKLTGFQRDNRFLVIFHQHFIRKIGPILRETNQYNTISDLSSPECEIILQNKTKLNATNTLTNLQPLPLTSCSVTDKDDDVQDGNVKETQVCIMAPEVAITAAQSGAIKLAQSSVNLYPDLAPQDFRELTESWGLQLGNSYVILIAQDRFLLSQVNPTITSHKHGGFKTTQNVVNNSQGIKILKKSYDFKLIWSCPASFIEECYSDPRGDILLSVKIPVSTYGNWNSDYPVITDRTSQDYLIFQLLLEQTVGVAIARQQPLRPKQGLVGIDLLKGFSPGFKSMLLSPAKRTYILCGYVLYEYSVITKKTLSQALELVSTTASDAVHNHNIESEAKAVESKRDGDEFTIKMVRDIFTERFEGLGNKSTLEKYDHQTQSNPTNSNVKQQQENLDNIFETLSNGNETYLSCVYPLVDLQVEGPYHDSAGFYSISLQRKDGVKMRILKHDDESSLFTEGEKKMLTMLFPSQQLALHWRQMIEQHMARNVVDRISFANPQEVIKRYCHSQTNFPTLKTINNVFRTINSEISDLVETDSIVKTLVIPTSAEDIFFTENLKLQIAQVLRPNFSRS